MGFMRKKNGVRGSILSRKVATAGRGAGGRVNLRDPYNSCLEYGNSYRHSGGNPTTGTIPYLDGSYHNLQADRSDRHWTRKP
jgi:hypothetical protein